MVQKKSLNVDKFSLDEEWVEQPNLYREAAEKLATARKEYDEAKSFLEVEKADIDREVRKDPEAFGLSKITEPVVAGAVTASKRCQQAVQEVIDRRYEMDIMEAYVDALDHRKTALVKLTDLFLASYFSRPRPSSAPAGEQTDEWEKQKARSRNRGRER